MASDRMDMASNLIEGLPKEMRKAAQATLDTLDILKIPTSDGYMCARAGWTIELMFHEADTLPVRERAWQVVDLFCQTVGPENLALWWDGVPKALTSTRAQATIAKLKPSTLDNPSGFAMIFYLASGNPRPADAWVNNAPEFRLYCRIENKSGIWINERRAPGVGPNMSFIRMTFPPSWVASQPAERNTAALTSRMVTLMQPFWCSAGWGISGDVEEKFGPEINCQQNLYPFLQRFPGLNAIHYKRLMNFIFNNAMHSVTWLNYVSDPLLEKLGGREQVKEQVKASKYLRAKDVGNCLGIAAGNFPWLGDTKNNMTLPAYGEAARLLKPVRIKSYGHFWGNFTGNMFVAPPPRGSNDKQAWELACDAYLSRFDND